ncbi:MAG: hypothetical protein KDJ35_04240 [Alphaproteobacteria bacterium]|nr:hypothetical protein [Alphaproteobacteria bacterium]
MALMKKSKTITVFVCLYALGFGALGVLSASAPAQAQNYWLKKGESNGFFSKLFGGNKAKTDDAKTQKKPDKSPQKAAIHSAAIDQNALKLPGYEPEPKLGAYTLEHAQNTAALGECTPQDQQLYQKFEQELKNSHSRAGDLSRAPEDSKRVPSLPDPEDKEFVKKAKKLVPQDGLYGMMSDEQTARAAVTAMLRCQNWQQLSTQKAAREKLSQQ